MRIACALWLVLLGGCRSEPPAADYFPLDAGLRWTYREIIDNPLGRRSRELQIRSLGPQSLGGQRLHVRLSSDGTRYFHAVDAGGIHRHAVQTLADSAPRFDPAPRTVLPLPPVLDAEWSLATRPYALERAEPFRERFSRDASKTLELRLRVAATDDRVEVPGGRFEHCLRIEGAGRLHVLADPRIGASEVIVTQQEWYAPGVGLVKLLREEPLATTQIVGGRVSLELLAFDH